MEQIHGTLQSAHVWGKRFGKIIQVAAVVDKWWGAIEWDFGEYLGINALEFFLAPCPCCKGRDWQLRNWDQFSRFYFTVSQITGSMTQAMQINDPDVIEQMCLMQKSTDWSVSKPPPWWRFDDKMHRLTDIADQLIASRAQSDKVKFYPRPVNAALKERERRSIAMQDDLIEKARTAGA